MKKSGSDLENLGIIADRILRWLLYCDSLAKLNSFHLSIDEKKKGIENLFILLLF